MCGAVPFFVVLCGVVWCLVVWCGAGWSCAVCVVMCSDAVFHVFYSVTLGCAAYALLCIDGRGWVALFSVALHYV